MKQRAERNHTRLGIAVACMLLTAILGLSVRIGEITVSGSSRYSPEQIEGILFAGHWGKNTAAAWLKNQFQPHHQIPFVEDYKVVFHSPFRVEVIIYDKSIVGYVTDMSSYLYFDKDGIIVESSGRRLEGVPLVNGLHFGRMVLYQPLPVDNPQIFEQILNLTQQLYLYEIPVNEIRYDEYGEPWLTIGEMKVTLGSSIDIDGKLSTLNDILKAQPQIKEMKGTLELNNYTESNNRAGITFKKK